MEDISLKSADQVAIIARKSLLAHAVGDHSPIAGGEALLKASALVQPAPVRAKVMRNPAMDFTKGALVLIMVLYHWLNYFIGSQGDIYKYLRFLTPSFIFITGFLVSNVYLSKYGVSDTRLPRRLAERALKILGVFVVLNVVRAFLLPASSRAQLLAEHMSLRSLVSVYLLGNVFLGGGRGKAIAFYILVPIAYLLLISALLLMFRRYYRYAFYAVCGLCLAGVLILERIGFQSANLELLTIGLLGLICGYTPIEKVNAFVRHPYWLVLAYLCYLGALNAWNVIYPVQVIGVFLSLMLIYLVGSVGDRPGTTRRVVLLLGKYSLFGYIAQIAILQMLYQGLRRANLSEVPFFGVSFVAAFALTILAVYMTDWARAGVPAVDRLYKAIFA
jgi:peptidoglycan/LPS O-acetylase OafA/YrhL